MTTKFPLSQHIDWKKIYPSVKYIRIGGSFIKRIDESTIDYQGLMVKQAYEAVEIIARERDVPVETVWTEIYNFDEEQHGYSFNSPDSPFSSIIKNVVFTGEIGFNRNCTMGVVKWVSIHGIDSKYIKTNRSVLKTTFVFLVFAVLIGSMIWNSWTM